MAYIQPQEQDSYQSNLNYLRGTGPIPTGGGGAGTVVGGSQTPEQQYTAPTVTSPQPEATGASAPTPQPTGDIRSTLFGTPTPQIEKLGQTLSQARTGFRTAAGPSRDYEDVQGKVNLFNTMPDVLKDTAQFRPLWEDVAKLKNADYGGPTELDQESMASAERLSQDIRDYGNALQTPGGVASLVHRAAPQLTPGQARFESQQLTSDPAFQSEASKKGQELRRIVGQVPVEQAKARSFAAQREGEEADIASSTKEQMASGLAERMGVAREREAEELAAYNKRIADIQAFNETGDFSVLAEYFDPEFADTAIQAQQEEAQAAWDETLTSYHKFMEQSGFPVPDDGGTGLLMRSSGSGREKFTMDKEYKKKLEDVGLTKGDIRRLKKGVLIPTQKQLEEKFGPRTKRVKEVGEYAYDKPLYFGEDFSEIGPDPKGYVTYEPGMFPTIDNVTPEEEKRAINAMNEMLGTMERLQETDPRQAAVIGAEIDAFLTDQEQAYEAQKENISKRSKQWRGYISDFRDRYREASEFGKQFLIHSSLEDWGPFGKPVKKLMNQEGPRDQGITSRDFGG